MSSYSNTSHTIPEVLTLPAMVREFIATTRVKERDELAFFQEGTFEQALRRAASATSRYGKRFSHQRRLTQASLRNAEKALISQKHSLRECQSFEEVLNLVQAIVSSVSGVGELYAYDTALRIAAWLKYAPKQVHLHAGVREGARRMGLAIDRASIPTTEFPAELQRLKAYEIETFLCHYKDRLSAAML